LKKTFVLDTNVILSDPRCLYKFEDNTIHIPLIVIEELDGLKKGHDEKARNAREFSRTVDALRKDGSLASGVELHTGAVVQITSVPKADDVPLGLNLKVNDDLIIYTAIKLKQQGKCEPIIVSKDLNVRLKADALKLKAEDYKADKIKVEDDKVYSGTTRVEIDKDLLDDFRENKTLEWPLLNKPHANQYFIITETGNKRNSALGKYDKASNSLVALIENKEGTWGIHPKNAEQRFAIDALLDDNVKLVSLVGKAGTGKTLLAVATGLEKTINDNKFRRMLISRPVVPMGKDIGYLPGDIKDKLDPWMQPIYDNLDHLFGHQSGTHPSWEPLIEQGHIKIEALTYIRGRSIPKQFMIVDEAQNLSPHEIKTIVTRVGDDTKIIFTGDTDQIDSPYLDAINNGLTYLVDRLKDEAIISHVELTKGERSKLAEIATKLL
jgi:PhoH-like ATPase